MTDAAIIDHLRREPIFEFPPRFSGADDRRLGGRIAAQWEAQCSGQRPPTAAALRTVLSARDGNLVWLARIDDRIEVREIGRAVGATFGVEPGNLSTRTPFIDALTDAFARSMARAGPATFEGGFARGGGVPTLLTRGVVVPYADDAAADTACAVITWTEMLSPVDSGRLRRELLSALAAPRSAVGSVPARAMW